MPDTRIAMGANGQKDRRLSLRKYIFWIASFMAGDAFLLFLIIRPVIRFHLYEELSFYLGTLALVAWFVGGYITTLLINKGHYPDSGSRFFSIVTIIGLLGSMVLGTYLKYDNLLAFVGWLIVCLLWTVVLIICMINDLKIANKR
ncbi:hypothetical protein ACFLYF_04035 [Chloroflexota bacterium]